MEMEYRRLGKSGLQVSALSFGSWVTFGGQVNDDTAKSCLYTAYDHGVNFFDNAEAYAGGKSEQVMGKILKEAGWSRDTFIVSSKVFWGGKLPNQTGLSRKHVMEACEAALRRLQVDYLDLYFCHRPDPQTPIEETVRAMHSIVESGKALYWGTSEWEAADILEAISIAERHHLHKPIVEQPVYNLFEQHRFAADYDAVYKEQGYGSTTWSPLASGVLTGKYRKGIPKDSRGALKGYEWLQQGLLDEQRQAVVERLEPIASDMGASLAQFSLAWCLQNPSVSSVITGASRVSQVHENMKALEFVDQFTPERMAAIDTALAGGVPRLT